jgi:glycerol-3-phosphate cytidylyltransferase
VNILTIGSFDGLHVGHLELLKESRTIADSFDARLIVGLNTDEFIGRYKGRPPVHLYRHRVEMLDALHMVDAVICNVGDEDSRPCIEVAHPLVLTIGDDWLDSDGSQDRYWTQLGVTREWMEDRGLAVMYIPRTRGVSSSALRDR